jgi:hypothetical protein
MKAMKPLCGAVRKQVGKYAVCGLLAGHCVAKTGQKSPHWDKELRVSWNDKQAVEMKAA